MKKTFTINEAPYSVHALLYADGAAPYQSVVVCCHGFGGHKEGGAMQRFAEYMLSRHHDLTVVCFDWPCHGEDVRRKLTLSDCDAYLRLVCDYAKEKLGARELYLYATSFGGYLALKYIAEHGNPFAKAVFRCPAVPMGEVLERNIMTEENRTLLVKGKGALVGFDRKIMVSPDFLRELREADIRQISFRDWAEDILILHGTKDEIVPFEAVRRFADANGIAFLPSQNADHRYLDPAKMTEAIRQIDDFFGLYSVEQSKGGGCEIGLF